MLDSKWVMLWGFYTLEVGDREICLRGLGTLSRGGPAFFRASFMSHNVIHPYSEHPLIRN